MDKAISEYLNSEKYQPELYDDDGWKLLEDARSELDRHDAAIAAAVQAEREACAKRIEELADDGERAVAIMSELGYEAHESYLAKALRLGAAAIRARNESK